MMYHLAKYPSGCLTIWETEEKWDEDISFTKFILGNGSARHRPCQNGPNPEASFFMAQFVIFSADNIDEVIEHATLISLDEKVVADDDYNAL
jgi:hypothetical protein